MTVSSDVSVTASNLDLSRAKQRPRRMSECESPRDLITTIFADLMAFFFRKSAPAMGYRKSVPSSTSSMSMLSCFLKHNRLSSQFSVRNSVLLANGSILATIFILQLWTRIFIRHSWYYTGMVSLSFNDSAVGRCIAAIGFSVAGLISILIAGPHMHAELLRGFPNSRNVVNLLVWAWIWASLGLALVGCFPMHPEYMSGGHDYLTGSMTDVDYYTVHLVGASMLILAGNVVLVSSGYLCYVNGFEDATFSLAFKVQMVSLIYACSAITIMRFYDIMDRYIHVNAVGLFQYMVIAAFAIWAHRFTRPFAMAKKS